MWGRMKYTVMLNPADDSLTGAMTYDLKAKIHMHAMQADFIFLTHNVIEDKRMLHGN